MNTELEAKYRLETATSAQHIVSLTHIGTYRLEADPEPEEQENTYFDTVDGRLQRLRYGLRLRRVGERTIATLKGESIYHDGVFERAEYEVEASQPDPHTWPQSAARTQALELLGDAELLVLLRIVTRRQHVRVWRDEQQVAEISLDHGTIQAGDLREVFDEMEIEVLPAGSRADLDALIAGLREQLPLIAEPRSKLERGLALLARRPQQPRASL